MKKYIILILLFYCIIGNCFRIYQNKIFGDMANLRIDSIKVEYFHSLLTKSDFTITINMNKEALFILDSLARKECIKDIKHDISQDWEYVYYPAKLNYDDEDFLLSCINVFFISKTGKIFKLRRKEKFYRESEDDYLGITYYKGKRKDKNEKTIIPCQYDSIEYWAPKLYLVSVGKKLGIFKTDDGSLIYKNEYNKLSKLKDGQITVLPTDSKVNNASVKGKIIQNALNRPHGNKGKHPMQQIQVYGAVRKRIKFHGRVVQLLIALLDNGKQIKVSEDSFVDPLPKINSFHVGDKIHLIMNVDKNGNKYISRVIK